MSAIQSFSEPQRSLVVFQISKYYEHVTFSPEVSRGVTLNGGRNGNRDAYITSGEYFFRVLNHQYKHLFAGVESVILLSGEMDSLGRRNASKWFFDRKIKNEDLGQCFSITISRVEAMPLAFHDGVNWFGFGHNEPKSIQERKEREAKEAAVLSAVSLEAAQAEIFQLKQKLVANRITIEALTRLAYPNSTVNNHLPGSVEFSTH